MHAIRPCRPEEAPEMLAIINAAAQAYRGAIPADCWHEPYMSDDELRAELAAGVAFVACDLDGVMAGVMGIQPVRNVQLIRHAYVSPEYQGQGIGGAMMRQLRARSRGPILIGTWAAATWAVRFYEGHGFRLVPESAKAPLLRTYWSIPERQIATSVVLADPPLDDEGAGALIAASERG